MKQSSIMNSQHLEVEYGGGRRSFLTMTGLVSAAALTSAFGVSSPHAETTSTSAGGEFVFHRNGLPINDLEALEPLTFAGFAHATYFQVRNGQTRAIDLHLKRLRDASLDMYGVALPNDQVQGYLRAAVESSPPNHSVIATIYSPAGEFTASGHDATPQMLVRTVGPWSAQKGPLALAPVEHERDLPHVKHVGEVGKTYYMRQAARQGFDDALFVDRHGRISEGTIWNLAFWDGEEVIWPDADILLGTTMGIVRRQLDRLGVPQKVEEVRQEDLPRMSGAVVMNSLTPGIAIDRIGSVPIPEAPEFVAQLHEAFAAEVPAAL